MSLDAYRIRKYLQWSPSAVRAYHVSFNGILEYLVVGLPLPYSIGGTQMGSVCSGVMFGRVVWPLLLDASDLVK